MAPVLAVMAWTFLKVGTATRVQALKQERRIRAFQAAEAALRCHLLSGQPARLELNGCHARAWLANGKIEANATPDENPSGSVTITLELDRGYVIRRLTNEDV
jgi:hypothetical protein